MKEYKFDVKKMTDTFNNFTSLVCEDLNISGDITDKQMSEMIQKHANKLGFVKHESFTCFDYIVLRDNYIEVFNFLYGADEFSQLEIKEIGLEFFSIKPEPKMVTVKMPEVDYSSMTIDNGYCEIMYNINKWELIK